MLSITDIESRLIQKEQGIFQKIGNEIIARREGYEPFDYIGSQLGTDKTTSGTPDSVFKKDNKYIFVEYTTFAQNKLNGKINGDIDKCLKEVKDKKLEDKVIKIIFMHNRKQPSLSKIKEFEKKCGNIEFEIIGAATICNIIQQELPYIAEQYLGLKDTNKLYDISKEQIANLIKDKVKEEEFDKVINHINSLYSRAGKIINNSSTLLYIGQNNKKELNEIYNELDSLQYLYKDKPKNETKLYFHNLLVILQRINKVQYVEKFEIEYEKNNLSKEDYELYLNTLIEINDIPKVIKKLEILYFNNGEKEQLINLAKCYFINGEFQKVVNVLKDIDINKIDKSGLLITLYMLSKNESCKYNPAQIIKLNQKYSDMPLYNLGSSQLLYRLKDKRYKKQFKNGLELIQEENYSFIEVAVNTSILINEQQVMLKYLLKIKKPNDFIKYKILNLLKDKRELTLKELKLLEEYNMELDDSTIEHSYINGIIYENKGLKIKAIKEYKISYLNNKNERALYKYLILSLNTQNEIDFNILPNINEINNQQMLMIVAEAFKENKKINEAIKFAFKSILLFDGKKDNAPYKQYISIMMLKKKKDDDKNLKSALVILKNKKSNKKIKYIFEDEFNINLKNTELEFIVTDSNSEFFYTLIDKKIGDYIVKDNEEYEICEITNKYVYLYRFCFEKVKNTKGITLIESTKDDKNGLKQISKLMKQDSEATNKRLNYYETEDKIPLSMLIDQGKSFDDYTKLINTLMHENHLFYSGESIKVNIEQGFVLDLTSIIVLTLIDKLDYFNDDICKKIYISRIFKNKFESFWNDILTEYDNKEIIIGYDQNANNEYKIVLQEIPNSKKFNCWKNVKNILDRVNVVDSEFEGNTELNKELIKNLDKAQLDSIQIAKDKNIPYICDDLFIRRISNIYNVKTSTSNYLINNNVNFDIFMDNIIKFAKCNYIYAIHGIEFEKIFINLYDNFTEKNKELFKEVIEQIFSNEKSMVIYKEYFKIIYNNMKKIQYVEIIGNVFENRLVTFMIEIIKPYIEI